jgi:hypothetical protein
MLVSADGTVLVSGYNFRARGLVALLVRSMRDLGIVDLESEFTDGTFVITSNAHGARHVKSPPAIFSKYFRPDTPASALFAEHAERIRAHLTDAARSSVRIASLSEALQFQERLRRTKAEFELNRQHDVSREELRGFATDVHMHGASTAADEIADEMEKRKP